MWLARAMSGHSHTKPSTTLCKMKSDLKKRRNVAICKRVSELLGTGMKIMDIYAQVGEEFWLEETTIRQIVNKNTVYGNKC